MWLKIVLTVLILVVVAWFLVIPQVRRSAESAKRPGFGIAGFLLLGLALAGIGIVSTFFQNQQPDIALVLLGACAILGASLVLLGGGQSSG